MMMNLIVKMNKNMIRKLIKSKKMIMARREKATMMIIKMTSPRMITTMIMKMKKKLTMSHSKIKIIILKIIG